MQAPATGTQARGQIQFFIAVQIAVGRVTNLINAASVEPPIEPLDNTGLQVW